MIGNQSRYTALPGGGRRIVSDSMAEDMQEYRQNHTIEETAKQFGVSVGTVKNWTCKGLMTEETRKKNRTRMSRYRKNLKQKCVDHLGGKCVKCGYDKCIAALEFHHRDPDSKDFTISQYAKVSWEIIRDELDKCDLVCSNCHKEIHWGRTEPV